MPFINESKTNSSKTEELSSNMIVSNHVNSDHVPSFSCLDVWNAWQTTSGVYTITYCDNVSISVVDAVDYK
jgi:hypothetical protein